MYTCRCTYTTTERAEFWQHQLNCDVGRNDEPSPQESMIERRLRQHVATVEQQAARIAALEAENARLREAAEADEMLAKARLLIIAIDENLCMSSNPLTITTGRIVELLRDPARNPWASLMRAGKEHK